MLAVLHGGFVQLREEGAREAEGAVIRRVNRRRTHRKPEIQTPSCLRPFRMVDCR